MREVVFLTERFYQRCRERGYREIERKIERPYFVFIARIDGITWGLPFRSSIRHPYAFWTDRERGCGIDYTKAVILEDARDINCELTPHIRENEFSAVKDGKRAIVQGFQKYIRLYKKARASRHPRYESLLRYSTLQNYEDVI